MAAGSSCHRFILCAFVCAIAAFFALCPGVEIRNVMSDNTFIFARLFARPRSIRLVDLRERVNALASTCKLIKQLLLKCTKK